jgi:hypothetical protein
MKPCFVGRSDAGAACRRFAEFYQRERRNIDGTFPLVPHRAKGSRANTGFEERRFLDAVYDKSDNLFNNGMGSGKESR